MKLLLDQVGHHRARPQTEVQAILTWIATIDPTKDLMLLAWKLKLRGRPVAGLERRAVSPSPGFSAALIHL